MEDSERKDAYDWIEKISRFGIFFPLVPGIAYLLLFYVPKATSQWLALLLGLMGVYMSTWSFFFARQSDKASKSALVDLTNLGLVAREGESEFPKIVERHLIRPLRAFEGEGGRVSLLLSTPAYGYGVLGAESGTLRQAIGKLSGECVVELIFYSPDHHFAYWANVLLWSALRDIHSSESFALGFREALEEMFDVFRHFRHIHLNCGIWLTRLTTVRLFAFNETLDSDEWKAYVALTDPMSLSLDQYSEAFQARSNRLIRSQVKEFLGNPNSYFERIKLCPYTGRMRARLDVEEDESKLRALKLDYILGRTRDNRLSEEVFQIAMGEFLERKAVRDAMSKADDGVEGFLKTVLTVLVRYFSEVVRDIGIGQPASRVGEKQRKQLLRVVELLEGDRNLETWCDGAGISSLGDLLRGPDESRPEVVGEGGEGNRGENEGRDIEATLRKAIFGIITSGFRESAYAEDVGAMWEQSRGEGRAEDGRGT